MKRKTPRRTKTQAMRRMLELLERLHVRMTADGAMVGHAFTKKDVAQAIADAEPWLE